MQETKETPYCTGNLCDALRYVCDASYAVLPKDMAHKVGEIKRNFWSGMRWLVDKELEWIDNRVAGGDRLRDEWRQSAGGSESAS